MLSQYQILNKVLQDKDYSIISLNNLTADHFFNYKSEFDWIKSHYETYGVVPDRLTFLGAFPEFQIQDVEEPAKYLLEQLYKDYKQDYLTTGFNKIKKLLEDGKITEAAGFFDKLQSEMPNETVLNATNLITDRSRLDHYEEKLTSDIANYIPTGLYELDKLIGGIDRIEEFMIIAARTGVGKTWIGLLIAASAVMHGYTVGYYSGEMSKDKIGYRLDTLIGHINNTDITRGQNTGRTDTLAQYKDYFDNVLTDSHLGQFKIITPDEDLGHYATADDLSAFIDKEKLDILIVDQISLMEDVNRSANRPKWEKVESIIASLKKVQTMKRVPIVALNQLNRTGETDQTTGQKELDTKQLAGSDAVGHFATTVLMLDHKLKEKEDGDGEYLDLLIHVGKARDGGEGDLHYATDFNTGNFKYIPSKNDSVHSDVIAQRNRYEAKGDVQFE